MKRKCECSVRTYVIFFFFLVCCSAIYAQFGGGSGTEADPYLISTPTHLYNIRTHANDCYLQTADIDLNVAPYNQGFGWSPLFPYAYSSAFTGKYDGNGFGISNLFINLPNNNQIGLFGSTNGAELVNMHLTNVNVTGGTWVGGLVGWNRNTSIDSCQVGGTVTGIHYVGGLVGRSFFHSALSYCRAAVNTSGTMPVGGLAGTSDSSSVSLSNATGNVSCLQSSGGGILGENLNSTVSRSYALGNVTGSGFLAGGLVGSVMGVSTISNCFARGNVNGYSASGLLGGNGSETVINHSYSTGLVNGLMEEGGFISPYTTANITNCYWNTQTSGQTASGGGEGRTTDEMTYPYAANTYVGWDFDSVWIADTTQQNDGYPYLSTAEVPLLTVATPTFSLPAGIYAEPFQLTIQSVTPGASIYYTIDGSEPTMQSIHYSNPITINANLTIKARAYKLDWLPSEIGEAAYVIIEFEGGSGTETDPYLVSNPAQLNKVRFHLDDCFLQTADIDLNIAPYNQGSGWNPLPGFSGKYNGNGFVIDNLFINQPTSSYIGLFGSTSGAELIDIDVQNISLTGHMYVGGLVGECDTTSVSLCSTKGNINATSSWTGGLAGIAVDSEYDQCYSTCNVNGAVQGTGGLIGDWLGFTALDNCYATGNVTGQSKVGGLVGKALGGNTINRCFSAGQVTGTELAGGLIGSLEGGTQVLDSYWDMQISGQSTSAGGMGRTTEEMTYPYAGNTYTGWDFAEIWAADINGIQNNGYPYLTHNPVPNEDDSNTTGSLVTLRNYPNPFNPTTSIRFNLPKAMQATLTIYNLKGQKICTLTDKTLYLEGENSIRWNGTSEDGSSVPSGVYLYKLTGDGHSTIRKMTLLK